MNSRSSRFLWGVGLNYLNFGVVTLTGLWLTRFLLATVGIEAMGSWVQLIQVTTFLGLLDLGVLALMPRDIAVVSGQVESATKLPELTGRYIKIVLWQAPLVALTAMVGWWLLSSAEPTLAVPLAILLSGFTVLFPFRIGSAILSGLQDLRFVGIGQLIGYLAGTLATIGLAVAGHGLYSLAVGWLTNQLTILILVWWRIRIRHKSVVPNRLPELTRAVVRRMLVTGCWASLATVGVMLSGNLDVLAIGRFQDALEVLRYAFTAKLVMLLASQVTVLCVMVLPGMADVRASGDDAKTGRVLTAYTQLILVFSGWFGCVLLMCNSGFISVWVGDEYNFDFPVTTILVVVMTLRHWQNSLSVGMFLYNREKILWMATCIEGMFNAIIMFALASYGAKWVCLAGLFGSLVVFLPTAVVTLHRSNQWSAVAHFTAVAWWLVRFIPLASLIIFIHQFWRPGTVVQLLLASLVVSCLYAGVMLSPVLKSELGVYLQPGLAAAKSRFFAAFRHKVAI